MQTNIKPNIFLQSEFLNAILNHELAGRTTSMVTLCNCLLFEKLFKSTAGWQSAHTINPLQRSFSQLEVQRWFQTSPNTWNILCHLGTFWTQNSSVQLTPRCAHVSESMKGAKGHNLTGQNIFEYDNTPLSGSFRVVICQLSAHHESWSELKTLRQSFYLLL